MLILGRMCLGCMAPWGVMDPPRLRETNLLIGMLSLSHSGRCKKKNPLKDLTPHPVWGHCDRRGDLGLAREERKAYRDHSLTAWKPASSRHPHGAAWS